LFRGHHLFSPVLLLAETFQSYSTSFWIFKAVAPKKLKPVSLMTFCKKPSPPTRQPALKTLIQSYHPKLRYMVQTDVSPPWFVIYGSNLKFIHWSYKRHLERVMREKFDFIGTSIKFSFRDEKQIKANREKASQAAEKANNTEKN